MTENKQQNKQDKKPAWISFGITTVLYLAFLYWVGSWWGLLVMPLIYDLYISRKPRHTLRDELGRRHCVCIGGYLFLKSVLLPKLCYPFVITREDVAHGRLPLGIKAIVWPSHTANTPYDAAYAAHVAYPQLSQLP